MKTLKILLILALCSWVSGCYSRYSVGCLTISPHAKQNNDSDIELVVGDALLEQGYEKTQVEHLEINGGVEIITFSRTDELSKKLPSTVSIKYSQEGGDIHIAFFDVFREAETEPSKELRQRIEAVIQSNWPDAVTKYDWRIDRRQFLDP